MGENSSSFPRDHVRRLTPKEVGLGQRKYRMHGYKHARLSLCPHAHPSRCLLTWSRAALDTGVWLSVLHLQLELVQVQVI